MKTLLSIKTSLILAAAALALTACGGSDNGFVAPPTGGFTPPAPPPPPPPPPPPGGNGTPQSQAGSGFAAAFNQGPFDKAVEPMTGDIIVLDKTAEPIEIPDP